MELSTHNVFIKKIHELKSKAAEAGEFMVISHDETFKSLFAVIGQRKMTQAPAEVYAVHTVRGFTGFTLGLSLQRSTSEVCFTDAVHATVDDRLAA